LDNCGGSKSGDPRDHGVGDCLCFLIDERIKLTVFGEVVLDMEYPMVYAVRLVSEVNEVDLDSFKELCCNDWDKRPSAAVACSSNADLATL
jgi:hypothetical protein